jgi:Exostosin family
LFAAVLVKLGEWQAAPVSSSFTSSHDIVVKETRTMINTTRTTTSTFTKQQDQSNSSSSSSSSSSRPRRRLERSLGYVLVLLVLVYTAIFWQSIAGLARFGVDYAPPSDIINIMSSILNKPNKNDIPFLLSSSAGSNNQHNRQRQHQHRREQQQGEPKEKQQAHRKPKKKKKKNFKKEPKVQKQPNHKPKEMMTHTSTTGVVARFEDSRNNPRHQQQQQRHHYNSDHHQKMAAVGDSATLKSAATLLLNVPFYVYEEELLWLDDAVVIQDENNDNNTTTTTNSIIPVQEWILHRQEVKHSDDYWFAKAALQHPQRTLDPSHAKIFVVPGLFNTLIDLVMNYDQRKSYRAKLCHLNKCGLELLQHANDVLGQSKWFQRHAGNDHFLVASHYRSDWFHTSDNAPNLYHCHVIGMEDRQSNAHDRLHFPSTYVGQACPRVASMQEKRHDFAFVGDILTPSPMFEHRRKLCKWMMMMNAINQTNSSNTTDIENIPITNNANAMLFTMPFCGAGPQCPTLAEALYGFHVRGDTNGANRLVDTILSGTVPIFTTARQYQVLPEWIDWRLLSVHINIRRASKDLFLSNVAKLVAVHDDDNDKNSTISKEYTKKLQHVIRNRDLVDWTTIIPFDQYMYALSCQLWPDEEIKRRSMSAGGRISSPYSAYLVPRPGKLHQVPKQPGPLPQDRNISHLESYK